MSIDLTKLTPAPWFVNEWDRLVVSKERSIIDELRVADAGSNAPKTDMEFIAMARNAFGIMMRRGWISKLDCHGKWIVSNKEMAEATVDIPDDEYPNRFCDNPFTALVESDKWYREHVENKERQ